MIYLPDTNACVTYLRNSGSRVAQRFGAAQQGDIVLCDIVKAELYYGAFRSARPEENLQKIETFFLGFHSLPFDSRAAAECGRIRRELEAAGMPIGPYDLLIASVALANDLILVTHNTREFRRIPGLSVEDWEV